MSSVADNKAIQTRLKELGLYTGKIDGIAGRLTHNAIRAFQRLHPPLVIDGIVGKHTLGELFPDTIMIRRLENPLWPPQNHVKQFYGAQGCHQTILELPFTMRLAWDKRVPITRFSVHEKVHDSAERAFKRIEKTYSEAHRELLGINLFGGCLNVRKMRGGNNWSMHSWGIAIDFDPARNQWRWKSDRARLAKKDANDFWAIWEAEGWVSLGRQTNHDWMHVQAALL